MKSYVTVLEIKKDKDGRNHWIFTRCDVNELLVGVSGLTISGIPCMAIDYPVGSIIRTEFILAKEK